MGEVFFLLTRPLMGDPAFLTFIQLLQYGGPNRRIRES